ncbi:MAG: uroporphyrinogen decarboxylase family protein, partial [Candidatus Latescibacterota bacterium]
MRSSDLTHRERVLLALKHRETDRAPISLICSAINDPASLERHLRETRGMGMEEYFRPIIDVVQVRPRYIGPSRGEGEDFWGVVRKKVSYGAGEYDEIDYYPLAGAESIDDLRKFAWPSPDWFDYAGIREQIAEVNADGERCIMIKGGSIFEYSWYMRGFERTFMDMVLAPEFVGYTMERVADFCVAHIDRVLAAAGDLVDLIFTADDIGHQQGLLLSLGMWEEIIKPHHVRLNEVIHRHGARAIYHSDGAVMEAVPGLIDMGIDILQALQFDAAGMDPVILKEKYGDRLCFEGGVSVQKTLPFGSPEDVRREVRERIAVLGQGGGYILGPA